MDNLEIFISVATVLLGFILGAIALLIYQSGKGVSKKLESNAQKEMGQKAVNAAPREDLNKFMEFDKIEDDMIIQENGDKYVMVIKCQGINYDLMSETEMLAVEEGFSNFLNTLKYPIQLYVQSRSLNLEDEINKYKERLKIIREDYDKAELQAYTRKKVEKLSLKEREAITALCEDDLPANAKIPQETRERYISFAELCKNKNVEFFCICRGL